MTPKKRIPDDEWGVDRSEASAVGGCNVCKSRPFGEDRSRITVWQVRLLYFEVRVCKKCKGDLIRVLESIIERLKQDGQ